MTFFEETYTETLREQYELDSLDYMIPDTDEVQGEFKLDEEVDQTERASASQDEEAEPSAADLEATLEALERQSEEAEAEPTATARSSSISSTSSSFQPLETGDISSRDAGIGDGSIYVYVEVTNSTSKLYSYVGLDSTCYRASGGILGTGFGYTANVASGETVVVTMIFLSVPGCDNVKVRFDALPGLV